MKLEEGQPLQRLTLEKNSCVHMDRTALYTKQTPQVESKDRKPHTTDSGKAALQWSGQGLLLLLLLLSNVKPEDQETSEKQRSGIASN